MTRNIPDWKINLSKKLGVFGLSDLKRLAPIGDIGYMNGWYNPWGGSSWFNGQMEKAIYDAAYAQGYRFTWRDRSYHRGIDNEYYCEELGLTYHVDSSD